MNTSKITVRLDEEQRVAELELVTLNGTPDIVGIDDALLCVGMRPMRTVELSTPRYRVTRTKLAEMDGSKFDVTRVMAVLNVAQSRVISHPPSTYGRAA